MDDMAAYYPPSAGPYNPHYPYYQPPPALGAVPPQPAPPPPMAQQPHMPQHYSHQPPPPYASYAPHSLQAAQDELRTLFIAGLPADVKPREIYNLFREFPGYQSFQFRSPTQSSRAFAFAVFSDQQSAMVAMHALNGMVFDLEKESTLYIDLAKSNSRSKRSRTDDGRSGSSDKKVKGSDAFSWGIPDSGVGSNVHLPGMVNTAYNMIGYPSTQSRANFDGGAVNDAESTKVNNSSAPQNVNPCPTLFVANLGPACSEEELTQVFSRCPGFLKLKMQNKFGAPVAFVDFQDVACATGALNHLQGTILHSSTDGEGMRLEYAKSRMGLRKKST